MIYEEKSNLQFATPQPDLFSLYPPEDHQPRDPSPPRILQKPQLRENLGFKSHPEVQDDNFGLPDYYGPNPYSQPKPVVEQGMAKKGKK